MKSIHFDDTASVRLPEKLQRERIHLVIREKLTENQREILIAYYFQQRKIPEIAAERGVNRSTISRTLRRAEDNLKKYLKY